MPLEETVFVDLDDDKVVGMDDYEVLPRSSILSALKSGLKHTISSGKSKFVVFSIHTKCNRNWSVQH